MQLLTIGSVIQVKGIKLIIMGYREIVNDTYQYYYIVGIFPRGYIAQQESIALLPVTAEYEVVFEGYSNTMSDRFLTKMERKISVLQGTAPADVEETLRVMLEGLEEKTNE